MRVRVRVRARVGVRVGVRVRVRVRKRVRVRVRVRVQVRVRVARDGHLVHLGGRGGGALDLLLREVGGALLVAPHVEELLLERRLVRGRGRVRVRVGVRVGVRVRVRVRVGLERRLSEARLIRVSSRGPARDPVR